MAAIRSCKASWTLDCTAGWKAITRSYSIAADIFITEESRRSPGCMKPAQFAAREGSKLGKAGEASGVELENAVTLILFRRPLGRESFFPPPYSRKPPPGGARLGKAKEVSEAIRKATEDAKRNMIDVPIVGTTIPHPVTERFAGAEVMLKPASEGTGVIAGGPVRAVLEAAGVRDILTKSLGSSNPINVVRATLKGIERLRTVQEVARLRGKNPGEILG